jgi:uncharacterized protein with ParB-like and HNH nuclease domain
MAGFRGVRFSHRSEMSFSDEKKYLMPTIQREVVWNTGQIERLFDSLMRDDPVGSFLFWW